MMLTMLFVGVQTAVVFQFTWTNDYQLVFKDRRPRVHSNASSYAIDVK